MNKLGFLLVAVFASKGALASEVGAPFPQLANSPAVLAVAIAETGASSSLAVKPEQDVTKAKQFLPLHDYIEVTRAEMAATFEKQILQKLETLNTASSH